MRILQNIHVHYSVDCHAFWGNSYIAQYILQIAQVLRMCLEYIEYAHMLHTLHTLSMYMYMYMYRVHSPLCHKVIELRGELALVQQRRRSVHDVREEGKLCAESLLRVGGAPCR